MFQRVTFTVEISRVIDIRCESEKGCLAADLEEWAFKKNQENSLRTKIERFTKIAYTPEPKEIVIWEAQLIKTSTQ